MSAREEKKKRMTAALTTVGVNVVVFLILLFTAAWKTAGSGEGEYPGIEVNLGYDDQGSGDVQPTEPVGNPASTDTENSENAAQNQEGQTNEVEPAPAQEETSVKDVQTQTVTDPNSDVEIKEEKKEVKPVEAPVVKKTEEKPVEKKVEPKPVVDQNAVYKGKQSATPTQGDGTGKQGVAGNQGDDTGKVGDKGVPGGTEGAAVYKGTPGGGDGGSIEINGWKYDRLPAVEAPDDQTGRVVFEIELDAQGEVTRITKIEGSVSPATERECREAINKITFVKSGAKVPEVTKGKVTFVVRAR